MSSPSCSLSNYSSCPSSAVSDDEQVSPRQKRAQRVARGKKTGMRSIGHFEGMMGSAGVNKSCYRGVSYDKKKRKWRVQIKVAMLGKSGVSVGYFDTEDAAARAYDRAAISLLGRQSSNIITNHPLAEYEGDDLPNLVGKGRDEVKLALRSERVKRKVLRKPTGKTRTSQYQGVGASNRRNQWQARILIDGKITHLGYFVDEEEAARVFDRVNLALHGAAAATNFGADKYSEQDVAPLRGLSREELQRALGVRVFERSSCAGSVEGDADGWASPTPAKHTSPASSSATRLGALSPTNNLAAAAAMGPSDQWQSLVKRQRVEIDSKPVPLSALLPSQSDGLSLGDSIDSDTLLETTLWTDAAAGTLLAPAPHAVQWTPADIVKSDSMRSECFSYAWAPLAAAPIMESHATGVCEYAALDNPLAFPELPSSVLLDGVLHCGAEDPLLYVGGKYIDPHTDAVAVPMYW